MLVDACVRRELRSDEGGDDGDGDGDVMSGRREGGGLAARLFLGIGCGSWREDGGVWRLEYRDE